MNLLKILKDAGVESACKKIGIDFESVFGVEFNKNPYQEHQWIVKEHPKVVVINAVPPAEKQDRLFWEEWYLMADEDKPHHHILSLWRPGNYDEIYNAPEHDDIHPEAVFNKNWYVIDDEEMRPLLLRR